MDNLFEPKALQEMNTRINALTPQSQALWGKMNVAQMMAHCVAALETATGELKLPRMFIGRILGPIAKPSFTGPKHFSKNTPTAKEFIIRDQPDFDKTKARLLQLTDKFARGGPGGVTTHPHSFFGKLTPEEWSIGMYKHLDHHLRQFGA